MVPRPRGGRRPSGGARVRVFVAGATGVLGGRLVRELTERGHDVVGLTRDDRGDAVVESGGGEPRRGDLFDRESLEAGAAGADVVVQAATAIPTGGGDKTWELNDRVRREGVENLAAAAAAVGADRYLQESVVWVARQPDGSAFDEESPTHPTPTTASSVDAERIARESGAEHGFDVAVLWCGWFYAADSAHTRDFGRRLQRRRLPIVGRGVLGRRDARLSFLHVDDAASAYAAAVEGDATGTFHVVDDEPTEYATFVREMAERLGAPDPIGIPAWLARLFVEDDVVRLLANPIPTSNGRFREAFDWAPAYPTVREGLDAVVSRWRDEGFP